MKKILLFFCIFLNLYAQASRVAYTINTKTIIYSDENLDIPIGFIKSGRKIVVGDNNFKANTITALLVSGKIAFVKLKDITFKVNNSEIGLAPEIKEHDINQLFLTDEDRLKDNNHLSLSVGKQGLGKSWENVNEAYSASEVPNYATQYKLFLEHRSPAKKYGFGLGFSYIGVSSTELKLDIPIFYIEYQHRLIQFSLISIEAFGGINFSGGAKLTDSIGQVSRGAMIGSEVGGRARLFPFSRISGFASVTFSNNKFDSMDPLLNEKFEEVVLDNLVGVKIEFGASVRF